MEQMIFLAIIAGSTINLAMEDVLNDKIIPKPSFFIHLFLVLGYVLLYFGLFNAILTFSFFIFLLIVSTTKYKKDLWGIGDISLAVVFLQFNSILFFMCLIPIIIMLLWNKGRSVALLPFVALYFISLLIFS